MDFITIASKGNAQDFGDLTTGSLWCIGGQILSEGFITGGSYRHGTRMKSIDFITIASDGKCKRFWRTSLGKKKWFRSTSSQTRGVIAGGNAPGRCKYHRLYSYCISGNALDFGDLSVP